MRSDFVSALKSLPFVIALAGAVVACDSDAIGPFGLPGGVEIRAATTVFTVATVNGEKTAIVATTVVHNGFTTILFADCGARIYKRVGSDWVEDWAEVCAGVDGDFSELKPGGVKATSTFLGDPASPFSFGPGFKFESGALYRVSLPLRVRTGDGPDDVRLVDPRKSMSTVFTFAL